MTLRMIMLAFAMLVMTLPVRAGENIPTAYGRACKAYNQGAYFTAFHDLMPFAVRGDAQAQFALGEMLRAGNGTLRNREEAIVWTRRSAEQGHSAAQCNLGMSLFRGWGTPPDPQAAIDWWLRAAINKNAHAMFNLGSVLARGRHVKRDLVRAYWWMTDASAHGYAGAEGVLTTLRKVMTAGQVALAQKLTPDAAMTFERRRPPPPNPEKERQKMKTIRLELARNADNPEGNPGDAYELHSNLSADGKVDVAHTDTQLMTFARFLPGQDVVHGQLVKTDEGPWAFSYVAGDDDDERIVGLEHHEMISGNYVTVIQDNRHEHVYRVTSVADRPV
ncbi:MAG: hypothetical protein ACI9JL_003109 [Paracoccaceae bacterium]